MASALDPTPKGMLWGRANRFATREMFSTGPDPAVDSGGGPPTSPTLVNFSDYLRKQFAQSKQYFKAASVWSENSQEIPIARHDGSKPHKGAEGHGWSSRKVGRDKGQRRKKNKKPRDPSRDAARMSVPVVAEEDAAAAPATSPARNEREHPQSNSTPYGDEQDRLFYSPPKFKPIKVMKKKIYTNQFIAESDTPGPGAYNIATSMVRQSFNRVYTEPLPASSSGAQPNYLRATTASHCRNVDFPTNIVPEKDSIVWESPTKQQMMYSMKYFKSHKTKSPAGGTHSNPTSHRGKPPSPFPQHYPPLSDKSIHRWSSEASLSYSRGLRAQAPVEAVKPRVKQNVQSF